MTIFSSCLYDLDPQNIILIIRIRLIVSSTDISEEAELRLTSMLNETIKNYWVALGEPVLFSIMVAKMIWIMIMVIMMIMVIIETLSGPRNYGKSIEWKLEGDPWVRTCFEVEDPDGNTWDLTGAIELHRPIRQWEIVMDHTPVWITESVMRGSTELLSQEQAGPSKILIQVSSVSMSGGSQSRMMTISF